MFYATLGDQTPFADSVSFDTSYWMSIQVGSEPELSPRLLLTSVGSSISSQYAASVRDRSGEALRFVRGTVNTSGAVLAGRGFSVARNGIGDITITFSNPFSQQPTAIATSYTMFPAIPLVNNISNAIVRIVLVNTGSTPVDGVLGFVVTGPP